MKLSTVPWQRRDMLNKSVLGWVLGHLEDIEYSGTVMQIRYALSLLNSLLRLPEAVEELNRRSGQVLVLMARYLRKEKSGGGEWLFTVKAILVKLFKHKPFRQAAKEMNFETLLRRLINPLDFRAKKELEFMILYLNDSGNITQLPCSASPFEVEERIGFDPEIEADDLIVNCPGLEGELLLEEQFARYKVVYHEEQHRLGMKEEKADNGENEEETLEQRRSSIPRVFPVGREVHKEVNEVSVDTDEKDVVVERVEDEEKINLPESVAREEDEISSVVEVFNELGLTEDIQAGQEETKDGQDDNDDVVIGNLVDAEESLAIKIQNNLSLDNRAEEVVSESESSAARPVSLTRTFTFPSAISISSWSSEDQEGTLKTWTEFPIRKG